MSRRILFHLIMFAAALPVVSKFVWVCILKKNICFFIFSGDLDIKYNFLKIKKYNFNIILNKIHFKKESTINFNGIQVSRS
jgi:hypothetical protein